MEWMQYVITGVASLIGAFLSYVASRQQGKTDLKKLSEANKADIDKLIQQHEIDIERIREKHSLEMKTKESAHKHKLLEMEKESELRVKEKGQNLANNAVGGFIQNLLLNPVEAKNKIDQLEELSLAFKRE